MQQDPKGDDGDKGNEEKGKFKKESKNPVTSSLPPLIVFQNLICFTIRHPVALCFDSIRLLL